MPNISIIVPVYNADRYINKCINSILAQKNTDWELLLIDDGSTDNSGKICDEYASTNYRIRVFHKQNGGVSSARNVGLDKAQGTWIAFIDSDDYIDDEYLSIEQQLFDCDIIQKGFIHIKGNNTFQKKYKHLSIIQPNRKILYYQAHHYIGALWDKIIKRSIIGEMRFNTNFSFGEDFVFFVSIINRINSIGISPKGCYIYNEWNLSASTDSRNNPQTLLENIDKTVNTFHKICTSPIMQQYYKVLAIKEQIYRMYSYRKLLKQEHYQKMDSLIKSLDKIDSDLCNIKMIIKYSYIKMWFKLKKSKLL